MVSVPTLFVGTTQSGKTYRAFQLFHAHEGPALFWDVQWRANDYLPGAERVATVQEAVGRLNGWDGQGPPPKIVIQNEQYTELDVLVGYLWTVHRKIHVSGKRPPSMALFLDEVSLIADRYADMENPAARLFTQCYQHNLIGIAITQRTAQTSRNLLGLAWDWYTFTPGRGDSDVYRDFGVLPPDGWINNPRDHHFFHWLSDGRVYRGFPDGTEVEVVAPQQELPPMQETAPEPVRESVRQGDEGRNPDLDKHEPDAVSGVPPRVRPKERSGTGTS